MSHATPHTQESNGLEFMFYLDSLRVHPNSYHPIAFKAKATTPYSNDTRQGSGRGGGRGSGGGGGRGSGRGSGRGRGGRGQEDDRRKRQKTDQIHRESIMS